MQHGQSPQILPLKNCIFGCIPKDNMLIITFKEVLDGVKINKGIVEEVLDYIFIVIVGIKV